MGDIYEPFISGSEGSRYKFLPLEVHSDGTVHIKNLMQWDVNSWPSMGPTAAPVDPATQEPTIAPVEPTTTGAPGPTLSPQHCRTCSTFCAPCKECTEGPDGSFAYGSCEKCWHCWDWDDDELEDDDDDMDKDCDALHKDHNWDDDEVRCLTHDHEDCRACWVELGEPSVSV
jgi:hypothetical protein